MSLRLEVITKDVHEIDTRRPEVLSNIANSIEYDSIAMADAEKWSDEYRKSAEEAVYALRKVAEHSLKLELNMYKEESV